MTENAATIIGNIFNNNLQDDILSGNVLLTLSEHFSQFVSINRGKIELKKIHLYQRDYPKFSNESFRNEVSIQNWNYTCTNAHVSFEMARFVNIAKAGKNIFW